MSRISSQIQKCVPALSVSVCPISWFQIYLHFILKLFLSGTLAFQQEKLAVSLCASRNAVRVSIQSMSMLRSRDKWLDHVHSISVSVSYAK